MANISEQFIQHITKQLPKHHNIDEFLAACQRPLRKSVRANLLKTTSDELRALFEEQGYTLEPIPWCSEGFWIDETKNKLPENLGNWLPHLQGKFYIQEASSMLPVKALLHELNLTENSTLLDMAAAPGSKTTQISSLINNQGTLIANELSSSRIKGLHYNIQRCGVYNTCLSHADGRQFGDLTPEQFDAILLDAPCGGEGTVRKDVLALANWDINNVYSIAELQKELIVSAFKALKPGGRLVYSTCTLSKEENQDVCHYLLNQYPDSINITPLNNLFPSAKEAVSEEGFLHVFPQVYDCEGFFVACFEKKKESSVPLTSFTEDKGSSHLGFRKFQFTRPQPKTLSLLIEYAQIFGWDLTSIKNQLWYRVNKKKAEEIWLLPTSSEALSNRVKLNRYGIKLFEISKHGVKLQHQAATSFGHLFTQQTIALNSQQAADFYQGKDIYLEESCKRPDNKDFLVLFEQSPLGLVKHLGNKLKNNLPRDLVRDNAFA